MAQVAEHFVVSTMLWVQSPEPQTIITTITRTIIINSFGFLLFSTQPSLTVFCPPLFICKSWPIPYPQDHWLSMFSLPLNNMEGLLKDKLLCPNPKGSDSVGFRYGNSQLVLRPK
jgi:hypothetical protein